MRINVIDYKVNDSIHFRVNTNMNFSIQEISGNVVRITEDIDDKTSEPIHYYVILFEKLNEVAQRKYNELLKIAKNDSRRKQKTKTAA